MIYRLIPFIIPCLLPFLDAHVNAQSPLNSGAVAIRIDNYLKSSEINGYSVSVLVAKEGKIILSKGYGWADRKMKIPNLASTVFNIGSVTKQFTAAAILKLQEVGKLNTSDKLSTWFAGVPPDKHQITIHQLLTHTSGISPRTGGGRYNEASKPRFLREFFDSRLMYPPGTRHTYANANYIVLAAIVEAASGVDYESYLRVHFWEPLHMSHTGYRSTNFTGERHAHGYFYHCTVGEWKDWGITREHLPGNPNHWFSIGKGDIFSTVEDLYKWHLALEQNKVLSSESKKLMETAYVQENEEQTSFYGYGWAIYPAPGGTRIVAHNGSNGIYFADFLRFVDEDLVVIALSNVRINHQSENVAWEIAEMVIDPAYRARPIPKNTCELVFDFMRTNEPVMVLHLPEYIKVKTESPINDKAILNRIGYNQVSESKDKAWGIALLELNVRLFPGDGNLWDTLGEGYYLLGDRENAIASFKKALELKTEDDCHWCENASTRIRELSDNE